MISLPKQKGFSLVTAIFLLVILASIGAFMVTIGGTQRATTTAAIQGARAYQAARTGIDWAIFTIQQANNPMDQDPVRTACTDVIDPANFILNVPGLNGFTVTLNCMLTTHDQLGTDNLTVFTIEAIATSGGNYGNRDFVRRRITATVSP